MRRARSTKKESQFLKGYIQNISGLQLQEHDSFLFDNQENCCDRFKISGPDGSNYWVSSHGRHIGGSDADDA